MKRIKCMSCEYENETDKWTKLDIASSDSHTSVIGYEYDVHSGKRQHIGKVYLYACPVCRIITFT